MRIQDSTRESRLLLEKENEKGGTSGKKNTSALVKADGWNLTRNKKGQQL